MRPLIARLMPFVLLALMPLSAYAQEVYLQGRFVPLRGPGADARPPVGEARARVDEDGDVRIDLVVSGLAERATSATLHAGDAGDNTEQAARLDVVADGAAARIIGGTATLTPLVAQQVRSGSAYIVLRTAEHPGGVLRAQLAPQPRMLESAGNEPRR
ncbi:MAG TPA: CHRD domain-containing protein [Lysobacter sp.]